MKVNIQIKNRWTGLVIFELEIENNTILKTLKEALSKEANLREADLRGADLRGADLREADLSGANLRGADLYEANLRGANLYEADLRGADLSGADLYEANLRGANLFGANLREADLREADLSGANLSGANLSGADLSGADLYEANLRGAKNAEHVLAQTIIVPEGSIIGWKKCADNMIVKLRIPEEAKRSNATGRKCRAEYAEVLEIWSGKKKANEAISQHDSNFIYRVGETVRPDKWNDNRLEECAGGIHFFITRIEAENY